MGYFPVRYDSRVVIYDRRGFIRLATGQFVTEARVLDWTEVGVGDRPELVVHLVGQSRIVDRRRVELLWQVVQCPHVAKDLEPMSNINFSITTQR